MRLTFCWLPALALSAALLSPGVSRADTSYQVSLSVGNGSITGNFTTNGSSGFIEIDSWSFGVTNTTTTGSSSGDREGKVPGVSEIIVGNDLTADATHIYFNFDSGDGGYLAFQTPLPNGGFQYICIGALVPPCIFSDPEGIAITNLNGDGITDFQPETGNVIIGTVVPTPEPATTSLLLSGVLFSLLARRRAPAPSEQQAISSKP
jgi:hypothetical protein